MVWINVAFYFLDLNEQVSREQDFYQKIETEISQRILVQFAIYRRSLFYEYFSSWMFIKYFWLWTQLIN